MQAARAAFAVDGAYGCSVRTRPRCFPRCVPLRRTVLPGAPPCSVSWPARPHCADRQVARLGRQATCERHSSSSDRLVGGRPFFGDFGCDDLMTQGLLLGQSPCLQNATCGRRRVTRIDGAGSNNHSGPDDPVRRAAILHWAHGRGKGTTCRLRSLSAPIRVPDPCFPQSPGLRGTVLRPRGHNAPVVPEWRTAQWVAHRSRPSIHDERSC